MRLRGFEFIEFRKKSIASHPDDAAAIRAGRSQ
jgi:hypothetical protein